MKFYVSTRYGRRLDGEEIANRLLAEGHEVTSRWVWRNQPDDYEKCTNEEICELALEDLEDIQLADALITLSEPSNNPYGRGGRHVEFGYALGLGKPVYVVGPMENIFHYLNFVTVANTVDDLLTFLMEDYCGTLA